MSTSKKRYGMAVDTRRCVGCNACVISCKTENALPEGGFRDWIATETWGSFPDLSMQIRSERCNQCSDAPCVAACPTGASHVAEGGVVLVSRAKCTGCKACVASCPYGARYVHPAGFVDKCTFCLHRVKKGQDPACVSTCPTRAATGGTSATGAHRSPSSSGPRARPSPSSTTSGGFRAASRRS